MLRGWNKRVRPGHSRRRHHPPCAFLSAARPACLLPCRRAALAIKQQTITEAGAVAAAAASLATLGCSLRFGMVLLVVSYSSFKLRQFKEARAPDLSTMLSRVATAGQQQQQAQVQQVTRDWLEVRCFSIGARCLFAFSVAV
jgi:hypothetical protein